VSPQHIQVGTSCGGPIVIHLTGVHHTATVHYGSPVRSHIMLPILSLMLIFGFRLITDPRISRVARRMFWIHFLMHNWRTVINNHTSNNELHYFPHPPSWDLDLQTNMIQLHWAPTQMTLVTESCNPTQTTGQRPNEMSRPTRLQVSKPRDGEDEHRVITGIILNQPRWVYGWIHHWNHGWCKDRKTEGSGSRC